MIDTTRQSGIISDEVVRETSVVIVGAGAIGSHACEALTKMGVGKIRIFDDDTVESHNLANQGYFIPEIGYKKVEALSARLSAGTGAEIIGCAERADGSTKFTETFVISAVDSMSSREALWESFRMNSTSRYFIDGRMGARFGQVFFVDRRDEDSISTYGNSLFPDSEGYQAPCTEKATIFCAYGISSFIAAIVAKALIGEEIENCCPVDIDFDGIYLNKNS